jgi:malate dehydrogenase
MTIQQNIRNNAVRANANKPIIVSVTGAAGAISYALLPLIANGQAFGKQEIHFKLIDLPRAKQGLQAVQMELIDGAYPLVKKIDIVTDNSGFKNADYAILLGSMPRLQGMSRADLLQKNGSIFKGQGQAINQDAKKNVKVLVVGNPANTNASTIDQFTPSIDSRNISALMRLDHNRLLGQVAMKIGSSVDEIDRVFVLGNHADTQFPETGSLTVLGKSKKLDNNWVKSELLPTVKNRGAKVIEARGSSSAMSAAKAIADHIHDWHMGSNGKVVTMGIPAPSDNDYKIPEGLVFGLPVKCDKDGSYKVISMPLSKEGQDAIKTNIETLQAEKTEVAKFL